MGTPWESLANIFRRNLSQSTTKKIGVEWERFALWPDASLFVYEDKSTSRATTRTAFPELAKTKEWLAVANELGEVTTLVTPNGKISLEPGNQWEFTTNPQNDLHTVVRHLDSFGVAIKTIDSLKVLQWLDYGVNPYFQPEEIPLIPSVRYRIMTNHFEARQTLGVHMMRRTTSVQVNIDYHSETEAIEMLRLAIALSPLSYALFAHSPRESADGELLLSYRQHIWQHTDADRSGILAPVFQTGFSLDDYAKLLWKMPLMYLPDPNERYVSARGRSLSDLKRETDTELFNEFQEKTIGQLFTEARIKPGYVEVRSIDGLPKIERDAAIAFWVGLLTDSEVRKDILKLLSPLNPVEIQSALLASNRAGLQATYQGRKLQDLARNLLVIAFEILKHRTMGEEKYLEPLFDIVERNENPAQRLIRLQPGLLQTERSDSRHPLFQKPLQSAIL